MRIRKTTLSFLAAAATIIPATSAEAAGPPIAYGKQAGTAYDLYLTNPNGTGTIKLYTGPAKNSLSVDMNPLVSGGVNELAVVESRNTGFKVIRYSDTGVKQPIQSFDQGWYIESLDYHPSDGSLLIIRRSNSPQIQEIRIWANGSYGPVIASTDGQNDSYSNARWLGDGSGFLVKYGSVTGGVDVQRRNMSNPSAPTTVWHSSNLSALPWLETARCAGAIDSSCMKFIYENDLQIVEASFTDTGPGPGPETVLVANGTRGRYSPDNSRVLYRVEVKGGHALNVSNPTQTLAPKATYNGWDWRK